MAGIDSIISQMDALQAKRWKNILKMKVKLINKTWPPSKLLKFNLNDPQVVCYEREGLFLNEFAFDIGRFLKSRQDKFDEVKMILKEPLKPKLRDFEGTKDRLSEKAEFIHKKRVNLFKQKKSEKLN